MIHLLETDHLKDQLAALAWLQQQSFVQKKRIARMGNSFGGIEALLGAEKGSYCAAIDASGGAESWSKSPELQAFLLKTARDVEGRQELDGELRIPAACRESAHPGWPDGQSSGSYGASVDRPEFVSAGLKRFPLGPGRPPRPLLMVGRSV